MGLNINHSEKKDGPKGSYAHTLGQYTCILPSYSNIFSSKTTWPIEAKFYVNHLYDGGTNVYINNLGHMTKMAAMPIYGKNPSNIFFSETNKLTSMKLGVKHPWL